MRFQLAIMLLLTACGAAFAQSARQEQAAPARVELIDRIVAIVNKEEIKNLLLEQGERKDIATEYNIAHILVRVPEQATPEQLEARRARAEEAVKRLKDGAEFAQVAASFSEAPDPLHLRVFPSRRPHE